MTADVRSTIAELRTQLMELAAAVAGYAPPPRPDGFERDGRGKRLGPVWRVPQSIGGRAWSALQVRARDDEHGCVFIEGADFSYHGDWHAITSAEARAFAMALLAAADWSDGHDELGQRRTRAAAPAERAEVDRG